MDHSSFLTRAEFDGQDIAVPTDMRMVADGGQCRSHAGAFDRGLCQYGFLWARGDPCSSGLVADVRPDSMDAERLRAVVVAARSKS